MERKYLIVVDMQKDFIYGPLGNKETEKIVPAVEKKVREFDGTVIFTKDTHGENYLDTQEGKNLPVPHCIVESEGWELLDGLLRIQKEKKWKVYQKQTFGCVELALDLQTEYQRNGGELSVEIVGVCTDICVISNALLLKAYMPEASISVDAACCAGVTEEKHRAALEAMRSCQIYVR